MTNLDMTQIGKAEKHVVSNERMLEVLALIQPIVEQYNLKIIPDNEGSITLKNRNGAAECCNITAPNRYFISMANRVGTAAEQADVLSA